MDVARESEALHERVRAFARAASTERFEDLAVELARFQARAIPGFARLVRARGATLDALDTIPGVPSDAFRLTRVAAHPPELDCVRFVTSGTTAEARGTHPFRTTLTYEKLALAFAQKAFGVLPGERRVVVCLAPCPEEPPASSLGFMMELFARHWDARALDGGDFRPREAARWLIGERGVDLSGLERAAALARRRSEPLLVLATAFALVALLDALGGACLRVPEQSVVMVTGGFKGRSREIPKAELRSELARAFDLPEAHLVGEYGMTELSSQLYEATLPHGELAAASGAEADVFVEPRWLRVVPVDPISLAPVPAGEIGIARIVDLANVDSAVVVQTQDLVRRRAAGVELLGRQPGAPARGCSLSLEALLA